MSVAMVVLAAFAVLRVMACEGCGVPFSAPGAVYRAVTFEDQRCRRWRAAADQRGHGREGPWTAS